MSRIDEARARLRHALWHVRISSDTIDHAVYNSTKGLDVFRAPDAFLCAQVSSAVVAVVLVSLGWPR